MDFNEPIYEYRPHFVIDVRLTCNIVTVNLGLSICVHKVVKYRGNIFKAMLSPRGKAMLQSGHYYRFNHRKSLLCYAKDLGAVAALSPWKLLQFRFNFSPEAAALVPRD